MRTKTELPPRMAVGFRFCPTDEELIRDYLKPKLQGRGYEVDHVISEVDFCEFKPWDLPSKSKIDSKDGMWLFFCVQNLKLGSRKSSKKKTKTESADKIWKITGKRTTGTGFWKITGEELTIKDQRTKECIGQKRTLVFHKNPPPGEKTNWVIQLFYIIPDHPLPNQRTYALCRLKRKANKMDNSPDPAEGENDTAKTPGLEEGEPSSAIMFEVENPVTTAPILGAHGRQEVNQESLSQPPHSPFCNITNNDMCLLSSVGFFNGYNKMQALWGASEPEESPEDFANRLFADPDAEYYWETKSSPPNDLVACSTFSPVTKDRVTGFNGQVLEEKNKMYLMLCSSLLGSPVGSNEVRLADVHSKEETILSRLIGSFKRMLCL